jgi:hypothetical protein
MDFQSQANLVADRPEELGLRESRGRRNWVSQAALVE